MKKIELANNLLGKLEADIMEIIWKNKSVSVREVLLCLKKKRKIAYTTVMTVMSRLCDKGFLKRKMDNSGAYIYSSVFQDKQEFLASASQKAIDNVIDKF